MILKTDLLRSSPEASSLFGFPPELEQPLSFFMSVIPEADRDPVRVAFERTLSEGTDFEIEHPVVRADGSTCHVRQRGEVVRDADGTVIGIWGVIQDITEETKDEKRRELLWGLAKAAFWEYDVNERVYRGQARLSDLLHMPGDGFTLTAEQIATFIHPEDRDAYIERIDDGEARRDTDFEVGCRLVIADKTKYIRTIVHQEFNAEGNLVERYGINMDVTDRERIAAVIERIAVETISQTETEYLQGLVQSVSDILEADLVAVTKTDVATNRSETLGVSFRGQLLENRHYDPRGSICSKVISQNEVVCLQGAEVERLAFLPAEKHLDTILGIAIRDSGSRHIGEFFIGVRHSPANVQVVEQVARLCAVKIGVFLEQRRVEQRLRESESLFRDITENSIFAVRILQEGRCVYCNRRYAELTGCSFTELIGAKPQDYINSESYESIKKYFDLVDKGHVVTYESSFLRRDGKQVWGAFQARSILYHGRKAALAVILDITDRKRMELELREAAERFSLAAEIGRIDVWDWKIRSDEFVLTFGHRHRGVAEQAAVAYSGRERLEWIHPDDRKMVRYRIGKALAGEIDVFSATYRSTYPGISGWRWISARGRIVERDDQGIPTRMLGMQRDITEEKEAELVVREQEERLRLTAEAAKIGTWEWNPETGEASASRQWFEMVGFEGKEKPTHIDFWFNDLHPDDKQHTIELLDRHFHGESETFEADFRFRHPKQGWIWLRALGKVVKRNASGRPVRMLGTHQDVTQKKEDERRFAEQAEQLRHAQKMEAVGELAGGVAHEFNNLLQVISGYGELLEELLDNSEATENLHAMLGASRRGAELVRQLMQFSHKEPATSKPVQMHRLVTGMLGMLRRVLGENIELKLRPSNDLPPIVADESQLSQVIMNLCLNARDAIGPQGGTITIALDLQYVSPDNHEPPLEPGDYVVLSVEDTGAGMPQEIRDRIFDPFFTTKEVGKGTGLGLSAVLGIVEYHNGAVTVESEPGKGTVFHVFLPVSKNDSLPEPAMDVPPSKQTIDDRKDFGRTTVLVAEDNPFVLELAVHSLSKLGFDTVIARDGTEAVDQFKRHQDRIELLLLDIIMPGRNGPQVYRDILDLGRDLPVIFATGYGDSFVELDPVPAHHAFLAKPFNRRSLAKAIETVWGRSVVSD